MVVIPAVAPVAAAAPISSPAIPVGATPAAALQALAAVPAVAVALTPVAPPIPSPALDKAPVDPVMAMAPGKALDKA